MRNSISLWEELVMKNSSLMKSFKEAVSIPIPMGDYSLFSSFLYEIEVFLLCLSSSLVR